eukprot:CAMPEP_0174252908 /NCGR_PEP_ID=MMETSP0439-20130205/2274_1 /TAXON_ID=0 /ORGANISM="Stereomyxa ramosa, Strain Chinc5" /LENGTH=788 /DNA_ID=CAMNT_0015333607 /DNA_START=26 /DNA_END=2392 /DNA_ORIENTATION=-
MEVDALDLLKQWAEEGSKEPEPVEEPPATGFGEEEEFHRPVKRARYTPRRSYKPSFTRPVAPVKQVEQITEFLGYICNRSVSGIEVEAHLGKFAFVDETESDYGVIDDEGHPRAYRKGVKEEDFLHILDFLRCDDQKDCIKKEYSEYIYEEEEGGELQVSFDSLTKECIESSVVNRRTDLPLITPFLPYDCNVCICTKVRGKPYSKPPPDYDRLNVKTSWCFYKPRNIWKIELTEVHSSFSSVAPKEEPEEGEMEVVQTDEKLYPLTNTPYYYIRFDLMHDVLESLVNAERSNLEYIAGKYWQTIQFFSNKPTMRGRPRQTRYQGNRATYFSGYRTASPSPPVGSPHITTASYRPRQPSPSPNGSRSPSLSPTMSPFGFSYSSPHAPAPSRTPPSLSATPVNFPFSEVSVKFVPRENCTEMKALCTKLANGGELPNTSADSNVFPGSMPIPFGREHWEVVQSSQYFVSEKTDGLRIFLLVDDCGVFLIDRKFDFYLVQKYDQLKELYAKNGVTLIDGEMVHHKHTKRLMFLVFDVLSVNGKCVTSLPLSARLTHIRDGVVLPYRRAIDKGIIDNDTHPFVIIAKPFYPKKLARKLFSHISVDKSRNPLGDYYFADMKRHHKSDGLVLTPDEAYVPYANPKLFKWKFLETINFKLKVAKGQHTLLCTGDCGRDETCSLVQFSSQDVSRLQSDLKSTGDVSEQVQVKCLYDAKRGKWHYHSLRTDQSSITSLKSVFSTLLAIAQNISREEILYRIMQTSQSDDWEKKQHSQRRHTAPKSSDEKGKTALES